MWGILTALLVATPTPARPEVRLVDGACRAVQTLGPGDTLRLTYEETSQSCPPGGPCSITRRRPLPARELELWPESCEGPLPGSFVRTGRRCGGTPVWRWWGRLAPGHTYAVVVYPDQRLGRIAVRGVARDARCPPPARLALTRAFTLAPPSESRVALTLPREALKVRAVGPGRWEVELSAGAANTVFTQRVTGPLRVTVAADALPAGADGPLAALRLDARGRVRGARVDRFERSYTLVSYRGRRRECHVRERTAQRLVLEGSPVIFPGPPLVGERVEWEACQRIPDGAWLPGVRRDEAP